MLSLVDDGDDDGDGECQNCPPQVMVVMVVIMVVMVMMVMMVLARPRQVGGSLKLELYGSSLADLALLCHGIQSIICQ